MQEAFYRVASIMKASANGLIHQVEEMLSVIVRDSVIDVTHISILFQITLQGRPEFLFIRQ